MFIKSAAQVKLGIGEKSARVEKPREAVKIKVKPAIHQDGLSAPAQFAFLFCAKEQVIQLICKRVFYILLEEDLKRALDVLLRGKDKMMMFT